MYFMATFERSAMIHYFNCNICFAVTKPVQAPVKRPTIKPTQPPYPLPTRIPVKNPTPKPSQQPHPVATPAPSRLTYSPTRVPSSPTSFPSPAPSTPTTAPTPFPSSYWQTLKNAPLGQNGIPHLLTDGSVLFMAGIRGFKLIPDAYGDYTKGTWHATSIDAGTYNPTFYASAVLPDGRVAMAGGEYDPGDTQHRKGVIYDPVKDSWTFLPELPYCAYVGDAPSVVLADGSWMVS